MSIIEFPAKLNQPKPVTSNIGMTLTRNINGLTVSINLAQLSKEELLKALLPLPSESREEKCDKIELVSKYLNQ